MDRRDLKLAQAQEKVYLRQLSRDQLVVDLTDCRSNLQTTKTKIDNLKQLRSYIWAAALSVQRTLQKHISKVVTLALATVWDEPYEFTMEFVIQNNRTVCELRLVRGEHSFQPLGWVGGGVCDVVSFALLIGYITLKAARHPTRLLLVLDEPFRNLHGEEQQRRCSKMVKTVCALLGVQVIMISDVQNINEAADNVIHFRKIGGVTKVTQTIEQQIRRKLIKRR